MSLADLNNPRVAALISPSFAALGATALTAPTVAATTVGTTTLNVAGTSNLGGTVLRGVAPAAPGQAGGVELSINNGAAGADNRAFTFYAAQAGGGGIPGNSLSLWYYTGVPGGNREVFRVPDGGQGTTFFQNVQAPSMTCTNGGTVTANNQVPVQTAAPGLTASSVVQLSVSTAVGAAAGSARVTAINAAANPPTFTIASTADDTSVYNYVIIHRA
jgi:hypothetical protein